MPGQAASVDLSSIDVIQGKILDIAQNHAGLVWWGTKNGSYPRGKEVEGFPFLAVVNGQLVGGADGRGNFQSGELPRVPGRSWPVWDVEVLGLWPFHPGDALTFSTAQASLKQLVQAFTMYWSAEQTAVKLDIRDVKDGAIRMSTNHKFYRVGLVARVTEQLLVDYS